MVLVYSTCRDEEEARKLSRLIISRKLASCVNIWRIGSIYEWDGDLREEKEVALLIKTLETKVQDLEDLIAKNHTYSTPFVGVVDVRRINRAYKEWMTQVVHL